MLTQLTDILNFSSKNLQAVFFDFDGVLVDSVPLKTEAYAKIFQPYGEETVKTAVAYHQKYGGVDRYRKIRYISEKLGLGFDTKKIEQLAMQFSDLVKEEIIAKAFVPGSIELLSQLKSAKIKLFIVSGTPQEELREIVRKKLQKESKEYFFEGVLGSPQTKPEILKANLQRYAFDPKRCIFIGDAVGDFEAALAVDMFFIGIPDSKKLQ